MFTEEDNNKLLLGILRSCLKNDFLSGAIVGSVIVIVVNPLVNIKFNQQLNKSTDFSLRSLYRGTFVNLLFYLPITSLQVGIARNYPPLLSERVNFLPAIASGILVSPLNCALERIIIEQNNHKLKMFTAMAQIYKLYGLKDFIARGLFYTAIREAIYVSGYLTLPRYYEQYMKTYCNKEEITIPLSGVAAGVTAAMLSHPIDQYKTLLQASQKNLSFFKITSNMRIHDWFRGFVPRATINVTATVLSHVMLTLINKFCTKNNEASVIITKKI